MKKTLQENKGQMQKRKKKYQKHRANSKEEIVTLSQMNILPFLRLHYKPMTSPIWSHFSGCLHEGQAYGILISCIEYLSEGVTFKNVLRSKLLYCMK